MPDPRRYSDQDIQAIVQRALEQPGSAKGDLSHADLLGIGEQIGVSADALERAAHDVLESRRTAEARSRVTSTRKRWLAAHAAIFALLNGLLFAVNALTTPGEWWFLFSAVFWGLALSGHAAFALGAGVSPKRLQRERARIEEENRTQVRPQLRVHDAGESADATAEPVEEPTAAPRSARS
jgi:2TM domain